MARAQGARGRAFTGTRARLMIGDRIIGYIRNYSVSEEIPAEDLEPIDTARVEDIVTTGYRVSWSAGYFTIVNEDSHGDVWINDLEDIVRGGIEFTMALLDTVSDQVIRYVHGAKCLSRNLSVDGRSVSGTDVSGRALTVTDELQPAMLT